MNEDVFRKESLEKVKSPESLDDYIRISNPSVWLLLISIIVLLAGACVWGAVGRIDSTVDVNVFSESQTLTAYVDDAKVSTVNLGMVVKVEDIMATVSRIERVGEAYLCLLQAEKPLPDGFYDGKLVIESVSPFSFILN